MEHNYIINFCYTLYKYTNKFCSNEYGLNSSSSEKLTLINNKHYEIMEFFLFNNNGLLILNYDFNNNIEMLNKEQKNIELSIIQRTIFNLKKINEVKKNFITYTIYLKDYKIIFLFQNSQILVGKFNDNINNYYCHLCLKFIYISLINFKFDINEKISMLYTIIDDSNNLNYKLKTYKNIDDFENQNYVNINENEKKLVCSYNNDSSEEKTNENTKNWKTFSFNDYLEIKIYEKYFLKYLVLHFNKIFDLIFHKEELILFNIKLKNVYFIDLERQEIIFDFQKINNNKIKNIKYYKQGKIFKQCLFIAKKLENEYKNNLNSHSQFEYIDILTENFGKFECTSTYPRISFYIKYLPILTGIAIIHIYSQKKLSRQIEQHSLNTNTNSNLKNKFYINKKNMKMLNYYYEFISVISNNNIKGDDTLKYYEPETIFDIQKFFFEFFIASTKQNDIYYYMVKNRVAKYFNKEILNTINSVPSSILKEKSVEKVFIQINLKLENLFFKLILNENKNNNLEKKSDNKKELNNISKYFEIEEEFILFDLFKDLVKKGPNCLVKFDNNTNINNTNSNKKSVLLSIKDLNSIYPSSNFVTDNSEEYLIAKEKKENGNKNLKKNTLFKKETLQKKEYSKKSSLKFSDNNISSFELDDSSINMQGISRKVSTIFENNNKLNRKEFLNHRQKSFFEETDSENNQVIYSLKKINDKYGNFKRVMTFENGNTLVKYSGLKLGKKYDKNIASKKMDILGFSGIFGKVDKKKDFE